MLKSFGISGRESEAGLELLRSGAQGRVAWFHGLECPDDFAVAYGHRTSVLRHRSGREIIGAEHLSAAALAFSGSEFALAAPQGELPLLDGSARLWAEELERAGGARREALRFYDAPEKEFEIKMDSRYAKFKSAGCGDCIEINCKINRFGHCFSASAKIRCAGDLGKIFSARTYIFEEELPSAGLSENLRGCGIVIGKGSELLFDDEPAFHKILDFLGDISFRRAALPRGRFEIFNGGHEMHHLVAQRINKQPES